MERQLYNLESNFNLEYLVLPFNSFEHDELEKKLKCDDGKYGVRVWGKTILVDYEYYHYCHRFNIPFSLIDVPVQSLSEAVVWVCRNQLTRKCLPKEMKKYLIGRQSMAECENNLLQLHKMKDSAPLRSSFIMKYAENKTLKVFVRERIAREHDVGPMTVKKYENYATALDSMRHDICLRFVQEHLAGRLKMSIENIENISTLPMEEMCRECQRWLSEPIRVKLSGKRMNVEDLQKTPLPIISIKNMPKYDPDAEIASLALTIPSWQSSIDRVKNTMNIRETTQEARLRLIGKLIELNTTVYRMIRFLKEGSLDERL